MKLAWETFTRNRIYFVTCEELSKGRSDEEMVEAVLKGGVRAVQLRDKHSSRPTLIEKAARLRELTSHYQAVLIINDDPELALEIGADGVHVGQDDFPPEEIRKLRYRNSQNHGRKGKRHGKDLIVGLSTHNREEVLASTTSFVDYINLGPVFPTQTKENSYPCLAPLTAAGHDYNRLQEMIIATRLPFTVMGGIKEKHITPLAALGVKHFAMVSELTQHLSPSEHASHLIRLANLSSLTNKDHQSSKKSKENKTEEIVSQNTGVL